jgi:hypothetical protein
MFWQEPLVVLCVVDKVGPLQTGENMKSTFLAVALMLASTQAFAQSSCSEAHGQCLTPRAGDTCDAQCQSYCKSQRTQCMKNGSFKTRNHSWTGLTKS